MKWPWKRTATEPQRLVYAVLGSQLHWLLADIRGARPRLLRQGQLPLEADAASRKQAPTGAAEVLAVLPLSGYQMLQIEAPAVPAEEMRAAARWHIRDRVDNHVDDLTLDVLRVGPGQPPAGVQGQLFVVAAPNTEVARSAEQARQLGWPLHVIDVADLAQRNLHTAAAAGLDLAERATAALVRHETGALLTICVGDELFYSRRLDWEDNVYARAEQAAAAAAVAPELAPLTSDADEAGAGGLSFELSALAALPAPVELGASTNDTPRLVVELQRSFDVWERSWPDLPLALLMLHDRRDTGACAQYLQQQLGLRVLDLPLAATVDAAALDTPVERLPALLLGGLLRQEPREP